MEDFWWGFGNFDYQRDHDSPEDDYWENFDRNNFYDDEDGGY